MRETLKLTYTGMIINQGVSQCTLFKFKDMDGKTYTWTPTGTPKALLDFTTEEGGTVELSAIVNGNKLSYVKFL